MKTKIKRTVALMLAAIICLSVAACKNTPKWEGKWEISDEDHQKSVLVNSHSSESDGTRTVTINANDLKFKSDIGSDNVRVTAYPFTDGEINSYDPDDYVTDEVSKEEAGAEQSADSATEAKAEEAVDEKKQDDTTDGTINIEDKEKILDDVKVTFISENTIELSFKEPEYPYACVLGYYIHKEAVESGVFAIGFEYIGTQPDPVPTANIVTKLKNGVQNPTIELKLENTTASKNIKPEDVTLSGVFADMTVESVKADGEKITLQTKGEVDAGSSNYGYVDLAKNATESGKEIMAMTEVEYLDAFVDSSTFAFSNGVLSFDIDVYGKELDASNEELAKALKLDGASIVKAETASDKKSFKLYVKTDASDLDKAVNSINGLRLEIGSEVVGGNGITVDFSAGCASLVMAINSIDKPEDNSDKFKASAQLAALSGKLLELSKSDITFSGDFKGAEITEIENTDKGCNIKFTFTADKDKTVFNGAAQLAKGKLLDLWGTESEYLNVNAYYVFETSKGDDVYTPYQFVQDINSILNRGDVKTTINIVTQLIKIGQSAYNAKYSDALKGLWALAGTLGLVDSGADKLDKIKNMMTTLNAKTDNIKISIDNFYKKFQQYADKLLTEVQKTNMNNAKKSWEDFLTGYVSPLEGTVNAINGDIRAGIVKYLQNCMINEQELKLYTDKDGNYALTLKNDNSHSIDGKAIDDAKTVTVILNKSTLSNCDKVFNDTGYVFSDELITAIKADLLNAIRNMNDKSFEATEENAVLLYDYIHSRISFDILTSEAYKKEIVKEYNELCYQISGKNSSGEYSGVEPAFKKFMDVIEYKYNFQSEAKDEIENIRYSLVSTLFRYAMYAGIADKYGNAGGTSTLNACRDAVDYISRNNGLIREKSGSSYCYVTKKPITVRVSGINYSMSIKYERWVKYTGLIIMTVQTSKLRYEGYTDGGAQTYVMKLNSQGNSYRDYSKNQVTLTSDNILSDIDLKIIKARYVANGHKEDSFKDYMTNGGTIKAPKEYTPYLSGQCAYPSKIVTQVKSEKLEFDKSVEFVSDISEYYIQSWKSSYFKDNTKCKLIDDSRLEPSDFKIAKKYTGSVYNFNNNTFSDNELIMAVALYGKNKATWNIDEMAKFYNVNYDKEQYFIFPLV